MEAGVVMLLLVAVPFAFSFFVLREGRRADDKGGHTSVIAAAAEMLELEARGASFVGRVGGVDVELSGAPEGRQTGERVVVAVKLAERIATELDVTSRRVEARTGFVVGEDFDQRFSLKTRHMDRAERLLSGWLRHELVQADIVGYFVELDQTGVRVTARWLTQVGEVKALFTTAMRLLDLLSKAEAEQPELLPWSTVKKSWRTAAERCGGRFDSGARLLLIDTPLGELRAHARSERDELWFGEIGVRFDQPLRVAFMLADEQGRTLWKRVTERDVEIGDSAFDAAFLVKTSEPEALRELFDVEVRHALLELERRTGTLSCSERGLEARFEGASVTRSDALVRTIQAALGAIEALARANAPRGHGAYR